jgi:hypothetical protein
MVAGGFLEKVCALFCAIYFMWIYLKDFSKGIL